MCLSMGLRSDGYDLNGYCTKLYFDFENGLFGTTGRDWV